jgi:hypothetical protein
MKSGEKMRQNIKRFGAFLCALSFLLELAVFAVPAAADGPRSPGPDVFVTSTDIKFLVGGTETGSAIQGTFVTINVTIRNAGDMPSTCVTVSFYDGAIFIGMSDLGQELSDLGTGTGFLYCETVWNTTASTIGAHTVKVDVQDFYEDDNLTNNSDTKQFSILPIPKSHCFVSEIALAYDALIGDTVKVTATVKNDGTKEQSDADSVKFHVGTTPLANGVIAYTVPLPADNVTTATAEFIWNTSAMQEGPFFIMTEVASSRVKTESHIINLSLPQPNVYITSVTLDRETILHGESVRITVRLKNNGTRSATDEEVWMLVDNATSPGTNQTISKSIPKGDTEVVVNFDWNSTDSAPGNHTFKIRVPGSGDRNAMKVSANLVVQPRLPNVAMISFVSTPAMVDSGATITLSAVLENTGTADAYNQEVRFYLNSTDSFPLATKKMNVRSGASVLVNATYVPDIGETNVDMNFIAVFGESKLNDTTIVRTIIKPRPDLVVVGVDAPRLMTINQEYPITAVIGNPGRAPAFSFSVRFNLGTELPYVVKGLDLANGQTMTVNWTFKPTIPGSGLRLKVEVDATANVSETDEFNNINETIKDITVRSEPRASIQLNSVTASKKSVQVEKGLTGTVKLTVQLQNKGEKDGTVMLTITEGLVQIVLDNVTVTANNTKEVVYKWNLTGAKTHTAKIVISGSDTGLVTSRILSVDLSEKTPGFEALFVVAAVAVAFILVRRRK